MENVVRKVYRRQGDTYPQELVISEEKLEIRRSTDVLIKIHVVSLNYRDINILRGTNPWPVKKEGIPASDAAGEIVKVGPEVTTLQVGDRVTPIFDQQNLTGDEQGREWLGGEVDGVLATHCVFPEAKVVKIPSNLSFTEACILPCAGLTAWSALTPPGFQLAGKTVLVQGTGGVSMLAVRLADVAGARVILTSSSDSKLSSAKRSLGVEVINYAKVPNWDEEVRRLTNDIGVDLVLENGGTSTLIRSLKATARRGVVSSVGYLGQSNPDDLQELLPQLIDRTITLR